MTAKSTPGPWRWAKDGLRAADGQLIFTHDSIDKSSPDAKLIAAAPALADALNLALRMLEEVPARAWINGTSDGGYPDDGEVSAAHAFDEIRAALRAAGRLP